MKYVLAGLAVVAAVAALFFRPPQGELAPSTPGEAGRFAPGKNALTASVQSGSVASADDGSRQLGDAGPANVGARRGLPASARTPHEGRVVVYVVGEVVRPGVYALQAGGRAQDALARAGGPKPDADLVAVNLAAPAIDGEEIAVPKIGAEPPRRRRAATPPVRSSHLPRRHRQRQADAGRDAADSAGAAPKSVDLNSADAAELETLPGIGPRLAARIVAYREENGRFASVDELADVSGISPSLQDKVSPYILVRQ